MQFEGIQRSRRVPTLTPLIDIVFLLLVFFMLTAHFIQDQSLDIALPEAETATAQQDEDVIEIIIDKQGQIHMANKVVALTELDVVMQHALQGSSKKSVILRGDESAQLGLTVKIMDAARKAGARSLDILTEKP